MTRIAAVITDIHAANPTSAPVRGLSGRTGQFSSYAHVRPIP